MPDGAVEIEAVAAPQDDRRAAFEVDGHASLQHGQELLPRVSDESGEGDGVMRLQHPGHRCHRLVADLGKQHLVDVVLGLAAAVVAAPGDRDAVGGEGRPCRGEKFRHVDAQPGGQLRHPVVGRRHDAAFRLRDGRDRKARPLGQFGQCPAAAAPQRLKPAAEFRTVPCRRIGRRGSRVMRRSEICVVCRLLRFHDARVAPVRSVAKVFRCEKRLFRSETRC